MGDSHCTTNTAVNTAFFAHRGASLVAPENTMSAFRAAIDLGADGIELDVQRTKDGVIVVCHDESLERTANGTGLLCDLTLAELHTLDFSAGAGHRDKPWFSSGEKLPTLQEVLQLLAPTSLRLNIELKNSELPYQGLEAEVDALVQASGMADRVIYSSFNHDSMLTMAELGTCVPRALLYHRFTFQAWAKASRYGASGIHPYIRLPRTAKLVENAHKHGVAVRPWTVDNDADMRLCFRCGADALITNDVEKALQIRCESVDK